MKFDIGVILGSQSDQVWNEFANKHPAMRRWLELLKTHKCSDRDCPLSNENPRVLIQLCLGQVGNREDVRQLLSRIHQESWSLEDIFVFLDSRVQENPIKSLTDLILGK